ncbi:MAG: RNA methyltransferase [Thermoleophilia bacterium]|nr:RNA methyltransferase [Thermoleophilia bacterium]
MSSGHYGRRPPNRDDDGPVLVYGRNPVRELIRAGRRPVTEVWALAQTASDPALEGVTVLVKRREDLARLAGTGDHQGMVAITEEYPYADPQAVLEGDGPVLVLDEVQDPRNLGAVARVADAAGFAGLVIPTRGSPGITAVVCKASAGAVEHLTVARVGSIVAFVNDLAGAGRWAVGADSDEGRDYREIPWDACVAIVLGAEGAGLRPRVREVCDQLVRIPMRGMVGSLNLSTAAAVLAFEAVRMQPGGPRG